MRLSLSMMSAPEQEPIRKNVPVGQKTTDIHRRHDKDHMEPRILQGLVSGLLLVPENFKRTLYFVPLRSSSLSSPTASSSSSSDSGSSSAEAGKALRRSKYQ